MSSEHQAMLFEKRMDFASRVNSGFKVDHNTELYSLLSMDSFSWDNDRAPEGWVDFITKFEPEERSFFSRTVGFFNRSLSRRLGRNATINDVKKTPVTLLLKRGEINVNSVKVFDKIFGIEREK